MWHARYTAYYITVPTSGDPATAFQTDAFQSDAFQIYGAFEEVVGDGGFVKIVGRPFTLAGSGGGLAG